MLYCVHCACQSRTVSDLLRHIRITHADDPAILFQCNLQGCRRTFRKFNVYRNHVYTYHGTGVLQQIQENSSSCPEEGDMSGHTQDSQLTPHGDDGDSSSSQPHEPTADAPEMELQRAAAISILKIRELHRIPMSVMDDIISDNQSLFSLAIGHIRDRVSLELTEAGVPSSTVASAVQHLQETSPLTRIYGGLETQHQLSRFCRDSFKMVNPVKIVLGTKTKPQGHGVKRRLVEKEECMVYIPLLETLNILLNNDMVMTEVQRGHESSEPSLLRDYCDGSEYKSHPLFAVHRNGLQIMLYYDDVELCNPLGSSRTKHKVGLFYFSLGNLHPKFRSKLKSIQLVAICKHRYIKKYSVGAVLKPLIEDLQKLEKGYQFVISGVPQLFFGTMTLLSADNPASSSVGGFKEGSSAYRYCRHCLGTADETRQKHHTQLDALEENDDEDLSKEFGINSRSPLLDLHFFNLCSGALLPDVMHDVLEGCLQYELKLLLTHCIKNQHYFQLSRLNQAIECTELGHMETDRPAPISSKTLSSSDNSLKQKASQAWLLCRLVPYMVAEFVPEEDSLWQNYLLMLEISDLLFAPEISLDEIGYLKVQIEDHHSTFRLLYPSASIIPKMHYLVHTPRLITMFGPLVRHWTMRYEAKHSYFKTLAQNIGNYLNISWTLAKRHQFLQCYYYQSRDFIDHERVEIGPGSPVVIGSRPVELQDTDMACFRTNWIKVNGVLFKKPSALLLGVCEEQPVFAKVVDLYIFGTKPVAYTHVFHTESFNRHYHAYVLRPTREHKVVSIDSVSMSYFVRTILHNKPAIVPKFYISGTVRT